MVKTGAAAEAAAPAAAASVLISCFICIFYFGFSFDLILIFASFFLFANTGITETALVAMTECMTSARVTPQRVDHPGNASKAAIPPSTKITK